MKVSFELWMKQVNQFCWKLCGLSSSDLPDVCYSDWYEDGKSPLAAAKKAVKLAACEC